MTITQVSQQYNLSQDTLRYYEKIGLLPKIGRTTGGARCYSESDCGWVEFIKCMREAGVSIEALVEYVRLFHEGDATLAARKNLLIEQRAQITAHIADLNTARERLDHKIADYEDGMRRCEAKLKG